jgi:putative ATPase
MRAVSSPSAAWKAVKQYYDPTPNGLEARIKERLDHWRKLWEEQGAE